MASDFCDGMQTKNGLFSEDTSKGGAQKSKKMNHKM